MPKMDRKEIENKVKEILAKELGIKPENITPEKRLVEDLGVDSFKAIEVTFELKEKFSTEIPEEDLKTLKTVKDTVNYIHKKIK